MSRLTLYTTLGCHLCEQLETELACLGSGAIELERVEIAESDVLIERYGTRIPVLVDGQGNELERGFEKERLSAWLEARDLLAAAVDEAVREPDERPAGARRVNGRRFLG
ncbi:Glutaredoxin-like domain [Modicisalibacter ilicicola DSM 19980]|uniref:Glutaredoxin-like domain n=1 Tax=Modicisalibacter ilicicola DSM 19980 TaxID=1121942 RepID=A0A1M4YBM1_9GAMM|nr:glutaredoxin family protein [Halomonas ilicicola]SHF03140.1 Glutaredoxin-like domain [Halomonas ilicicola DSM 19980]